MWLAYQEMGRNFESHAENSPFNAHYDRPAVLTELGPVSGLRVLDAGCGPGFYAAELIARGASVCAFDASPAMVELARERTGGAAEVSQAVLGEALPYEDASFDLIVCALVLHHASDRRAAFAEFFRVLGPGGVAVVSTSHPMVDWLAKGGAYREPTLVTDVWKLPAGSHAVSYWREPLAEVCGGATDAGFLIERLVEPGPAESMRELYPEYYQLLTEKPFFLILRLVKR